MENLFNIVAIAVGTLTASLKASTEYLKDNTKCLAGLIKDLVVETKRDYLASQLPAAIRNATSAFKDNSQVSATFVETFMGELAGAGIIPPEKKNHRRSSKEAAEDLQEEIEETPDGHQVETANHFEALANEENEEAAPAPVDFKTKFAARLAKKG